MATLFANFLAGTITDSPLSNSATTINSSAFADLPGVAGSDIMYLVLDPDASAGAPEIVTVTAHGASATSVTVTRASQSTTARSHASGTVWRATLTKADLDAFKTDISTNATGLSDHLADTADAHDASAISVADAGNHFTGTEVEAALQELGSFAGLTIQHGIFTGSTDASGNIAVTFSVTFPGAPTVLVSVRRNASGDHSAHVLTVSSTGFTARVNLDNVALASTACDLHWIAFA